MIAEQFLTMISGTVILTVVAVATRINLFTARQGLIIKSINWNSPRPPNMAAFSEPLSVEAHWLRATTAVEHSLRRAGDMGEHQAAALRQLQAAEYALHMLLDELGSVMTPKIGSPLKRAVLAAQHLPPRKAALAA